MHECFLTLIFRIYIAVNVNNTITHLERNIMYGGVNTVNIIMLFTIT